MTVPPKRRWFRYSLRTLFVVVTVFAWALATRPYSAAHLSHPDWGNASVTAYYPNLQFVLPIAAFVGYITWKVAQALLYPR